MIFVRCFFSSARLRFDSRIFLFSEAGLGDFLRRSFSRLAISATRWPFRARSIASSNRSRASLRFTACERESWTVTLMPVGRYRSVTAVETLFTFWPPGPLDRAKLSSRSVSLISSFRIRSADESGDIVFERTADGRTRTGTGLFGPTDFKSVASTIPPHRRCGVHSKLLPKFAKIDFAVRTGFDAARRVLV